MDLTELQDKLQELLNKIDNECTPEQKKQIEDAKNDPKIQEKINKAIENLTKAFF